MLDFLVYVVFLGWISTIGLWFYRELQHSEQLAEAMRLLKAENLADYDVGKPKSKKHVTNYMKRHLDRQQQHPYEEDGDENA